MVIGIDSFDPKFIKIRISIKYFPREFLEFSVKADNKNIRLQLKQLKIRIKKRFYRSNLIDELKQKNYVKQLKMYF